jgi:hypothetical protein
MPDKGRIRARPFRGGDREDLQRAANSLGTPDVDAASAVGPRAIDVHANDRVVWRNVPEQAWELTTGGQHVLKTWLSYREREILGRGLDAEELREVRTVAQRLTLLCLIRPALDRSYERVTGDTFSWTSSR